MTASERDKTMACEPGGALPDVSVGKKFVNPRTLISFVLGIGFLVFLFTRLNVDFSATWRAILTCNPGLFLLGLASYYASFPVRGLRWKLLLQNAGVFCEKGRPVPSSVSLGRTILLSWFVNCILYARIGDVYRAYLLKEDSRVSGTRAFGTVLAERVIDMGMVFVMLLIASSYFWGKAVNLSVDVVIFAGFGMLALMLVLLLLIWRLGERLLRFVPRRFHPYYRLFQEGTLGSFRQLPALLGLSALSWLMEAGRLYFIADSLGVSLAPMFILFVALTHALITALPITPGGLGLAEGGIAGLLMLVLARDQAWSLTLLDRSITFLSIVAVGLVLFIVRQAALRRRH